MFEKIKSTLEFIAWGNFTSLDVYTLWIVGLLSIFLFSVIAQLISYVFIAKQNSLFHSFLEEFVLRTAFGISIISFILSFIGLLGLLNLYVFLFIILLLLIFLVFYRKESFFHAFLVFKHVFIENKFLWILFVLSSIASLLPPRWTDEAHYHLVYALKWVKAGGIYVEPSMRFPLYAFNFHVLHTLSFFFNFVSFSHLLSWLTGVLASFGIISLLNRFSVWKPLQLIAGLAFFLTPVVQQYLNIAYHDVPLMFFMLAATYALVLLCENNQNSGALLLASVISAMFVGMKISNAIYAPFFIFLLWYRNSFKKVLPYLIIFSILGGFWYLRNLIINGDPLSPSLNMMFGFDDLYWTRADYNFQISDLKPKQDWGMSIIYKLPLEMLKAGADSPLRYWPFLGYVVFFPISIIFFFRNRKKQAYFPIFFLAFLGLFLWLGISTFTRYAHFIAIAAVAFALFLNSILVFFKEKWNWNKVHSMGFVFLFVFLMIGPKISAYSYFKNTFKDKIPINRQEEYEFVDWHSKPYLLELIDNLGNYGVKKGESIYILGMLEYKYYFEKAGYPPVGDGISSYRYSDFYEALEQNKVKLFFQKPEIKHLLVDKNYSGLTKEKALSQSSDLNFIFENEKYLLFSLK